MHLISNGVYEVNINSLLWNVAFYKFLCSIFSKGEKPFDLIKRNIIGKLENLKSQTHSQINGGLIMFLENREKYFSKLVGLIVNIKEKISTTKKSTINIVQCSKY